MKRLLLMRHSYAENGYQGITDLKRNLTEKGIQTITNQAKRLHETSFYPDCIIASHALRANKTASLLAEKINFTKPVIIDPFIYDEYSPEEFIDYLRQLPDSYNTVLLVGHNPNITDIFSLLTQTNSLSFSPATITVLNMNINSWSSAKLGIVDIEKIIES
jgi:phosphohistidine phosphatase